MDTPVETLAQAIDTIGALDALITTKESELKPLKEERARRLVALRATMEQGGLTEAAGMLARAKLEDNEVFNIDTEAGGWPALYARIRTTGEFDLLQKRLSSTAVRERYQAGDLLPGVRRVVLTELKVKPK